jgi:plasmid stability protein
MAQLVVRNLDEDVKERLRQRAAANGNSMEAEARLILRTALTETPCQEEGLGTQIARIFEGVGMNFSIPELQDEDFDPIKFTE